jgi:hypothetical protein
LWFQVAERAKAGLVYPAGVSEVRQFGLSGMDRATLRRLKQQLMAPEWEPDAAGRRRVEAKDQTKEKIGRSPDDADAFNLAYLEGVTWKAPEGVKPDEQQRSAVEDRMKSLGRHRAL